MTKKLNNEQLWQRFQTYYREFPPIELALDISRMRFPGNFFKTMQPEMQQALEKMDKLEAGEIANPDENRQVGHYWLRNSAMAPEEKDRQAITETLARIRKFSDKVHKGAIHGADGRFKQLLLIGIGGSALGPQFIAQALGNGTQDKLRPYFFDNTDPDGMDRVLASLHGKLGSTLVVVISKSGGTKETRNGMVEAARTYSKAGLKFPQHAIAITKLDSDLDKLAVKERWLDRFPMWDWVGGRTSVTSAVGLLPAALQGIDITQLLEGARVCDEITRGKEIINNPAALLALMWYYSGNGKGEKDMVILPYKDRLELFSRYLQQLIMESLGKELNLKKQRVNQGIAVYGNKGSTDQHAYVQQLRDGINNFFVTFIQVLKDRKGHSLNVESNGTSGDYLHGFLHGTRQALYENGRESITITIREVSPFSVGVLIALYERTVGLYANLIGINAYHQPGVEAGKKAAEAIILLKLKVLNYLVNQFGKACTADQIATALKQPDQVENIFALCEHMAANPQHHINRIAASTPSAIRYQFERHWRRVRDIV